MLENLDVYMLKKWKLKWQKKLNLRICFIIMSHIVIAIFKNIVIYGRFSWYRAALLYITNCELTNTFGLLSAVLLHPK